VVNPGALEVIELEVVVSVLHAAVEAVLPMGNVETVVTAEVTVGTVVVVTI